MDLIGKKALNKIFQLCNSHKIIATCNSYKTAVEFLMKLKGLLNTKQIEQIVMSRFTFKDFKFPFIEHI